jgi:hypothetical protein
LNGPLPKWCPAVALSRQDGRHSAVALLLKALQGYLNFAFDQREIEVNLHKATTSPSNVSPASRPFLKPT